MWRCFVTDFARLKYSRAFITWHIHRTMYIVYIHRSQYHTWIWYMAGRKFDSPEVRNYRTSVLLNLSLLRTGSSTSIIICSHLSRELMHVIWALQPTRSSTKRISPLGPGAPKPNRKFAHWVDLLAQLLSRKYVFKVFMPNLPPPLFLYYTIIRRIIIRIGSRTSGLSNFRPPTCYF